MINAGGGLNGKLKGQQRGFGHVFNLHVLCNVDKWKFLELKIEDILPEK